MSYFQTQCKLRCKKTEMIEIFCSGDILCPTPEFSNDVKIMYALFCKLHPENGLSTGDGLITRCFDVFSQRFPDYNEQLLRFSARFITLTRLRTINIKRKKKATSTRTLRGAIVDARFASLPSGSKWIYLLISFLLKLFVEMIVNHDYLVFLIQWIKLLFSIRLMVCLPDASYRVSQQVLDRKAFIENLKAMWN